ncbi:carboxypeptidase regulatory-like domain-containing protein [Silvibacterium acidisoli]|uniref:carboxypeptidase regulatory-like domain-containing protein n=1 Tax=Acidobacteriaceae bacterium ZG23-2 TaxID=2883246 RepID=UPI00406D2EB8
MTDSMKNLASLFCRFNWKRNFGSGVLLCFLMFFLESAAHAQNSQVSGHVTDGKGSPVAGASVQVTNGANGAMATAVTNGDGYYLLPPVAPGSYELHATAPTFSEQIIKDLRLEVSASRNVDVTLQPAQVSQSVTVEATAPELVTNQPDRGNVIESNFVRNIPLNIRDPYQMVNFAQGVSPMNTDAGNNDQTSHNLMAFRINGNPGETADSLLDGAANQFDSVNSVISVLTVDAIQEFKVLTTAYDPQWGHTTGAVVTFATKSGTNNLHGSVWEYLRNSDLDANGFNANAAGTPRPNFQRNQFGYALGGPVYIPKVYNGRDRTFFFSTYEGLRESDAGSFTGTVPTELERQGDFSHTLDADGNQIVIYDPRSTRLDPTAPAGTTRYIRDPYPGNKIPAQYLDTVGMGILNAYPKPNQAGEGASSINNFFSNATQQSQVNTVHARIDHRINNAHNIFGRFEWFHRNNGDSAFFPNGLTSGATQEGLSSYGWMVQHSWAINANTVLTQHASYGHVLTTRLPFSYGFDATTLGFNGGVTAGLPAYTHQFPVTTATRLSPIGNDGYEAVSQNTFEYEAMVSKLIGSHTLKFGVDFRWYPTYKQTVPPGLTVTATSNFTGGPNPTSAAGDSGSGAADLLLGAATVSNGIQGPRTYSHPYYAGWIGDEYHVTPKLTVNYGLRYNLDLPYKENQNQFVYMDLTSSSPLNSSVSGLGTLTGGPGFVGVNGRSTRLQLTQKKNFDPRFGFEYAPDKETVVRGGFGIFHAQAILPNGNSVGYSSTTTSTPAEANGVTPEFNLDNPFPNGLIPVSGNSLGLLTNAGHNFTGAPRQQTILYGEQWSLDVQRQLPKNFVFTLGYVGSNGRHMYSQFNFNQIPDADLALGSKLISTVPNPFYGVITDKTSALSKATVQYGQLLRPHPQFQDMTTGTETSAGSSSYNAMQLSLEHRYDSGLSVLLVYTWSKLMDNVSDQTSGFQDYNCTSCDRSISGQDLTNLMRISGEYDLPFGKNKPWLNHGWMMPVLGGWSVGSFFTYDNGLPIFVTSPNNSNSFGGGVGGNGMRPDVTGASTNVPGGRHITNGGLYFNPKAFSQTPAYQFGNAPRYISSVRSPGTLNFDMLAAKSIPIHNTLSLDFRAEFFNAFNMVQFAGPNTSISSSSFGEIFLNQVNNPRQIQGSLRLNF